MKKSALICSLFLSIILGVAFMAQGKTDSPKIENSQSEEKVAEKDSFFINTDDVVSPYVPDTIVRSGLQVKKGGIWLATFSGLLHYDGKVFTNVTKKEGLKKFRVFSLMEDKAGNLWFGTIGAGAYKYDGKTFTNFTTEDGLISNSVEAIIEDDQGHIWFGTDAGVSAYDGKSFRNYVPSFDPKGNEVHGLVQDRNGAIWVAAFGGVYVKKGDTFEPVKTPDGTAFENVRTIIEDQQGRIWFGGNDGVWRHDGKALTQFNTGFGGFILEDRAGTLWISFSKALRGEAMGLYRYPKKVLDAPDQWKGIQPVTETQMIFGSFEDKAGGIWFGTLGDLGRYDGKSVNYFKNPGAKK